MNVQDNKSSSSKFNSPVDVIRVVFSDDVDAPPGPQTHSDSSRWVKPCYYLRAAHLRKSIFHLRAEHQWRSLSGLPARRQRGTSSNSWICDWSSKLQLFPPYASHKESALALFISGCLFILGNDLIRGFLVEHGSLWLNGFMWSQSTQVCTAGRHFRSLSTNPCGALRGEKKHRLLLSLPLLFFFFPLQPPIFSLLQNNPL